MSKTNLRYRELTPFIVTAPNADGQLGIENLKLILTVVVTFSVDLVTIIKERRIGDILQVLLALLSFGNIIAIARLAWQEFLDLSQPETAEISAHFAEVFDIPNDEVEAKVEQGVSIVPRVYELIIESTGIVGRVQSLYQEVRSLFGRGGELEELAANPTASTQA
jgi:hypothetical protein